MFRVDPIYAHAITKIMDAINEAFSDIFETRDRYRYLKTQAVTTQVTQKRYTMWTMKAFRFSSNCCSVYTIDWDLWDMVYSTHF